MDIPEDYNSSRRLYGQLLSNIEAVTNPSDLLQTILDLLNLHDSRPEESLDFVVAFERVLTFCLEKTGWLDDSNLRRSVGKLMLIGNATETLVMLNNALKNITRASSRRDFLLDLFELYVNDKIPGELLSSTKSSSGQTDLFANEYIKLLASLPSKTAPFVRENDCKTVVLSTNYFRHLCRSVLDALELVQRRIQASQSATLSFLGRLLGKMVIVGETESVADLFLQVCCRCTTDFIWRRIAQLLFKSTPPQAYEALLVCIIPQMRADQHLSFLLGTKLEDCHVERILTRRLFLNRILIPPTDVSTYRNLFKYFCMIDDEGEKCREVIAHLFEAWSTVYGQKYMAIEYEISLTKALMISAGIISVCFPPDDRYGQSILQFTMRGVEKRLSSTDMQVRRNGMLVGETVTGIFQPAPEASLKFEYPENEETAYLKSLLNCEGSVIDGSRLKLPKWKETKNPSEQYISSSPEEIKDKIKQNGEMELPDSDDDLVPYELPSEDKLRNKININKPKYLQDCFDGLVAKDDVRRRALCLQALPDLLRRQCDAAQQMTEAFLKVLFCMELEGSLKDAAGNRHEALVELTILNPKTAGVYIGREAIASNYGIGVRLEMLHILRIATAELSTIPKPSVSPPDEKSLVNDVQEANAFSSVLAQNSKTRRFASAVKPVISSKNRLTNVAKLYVLPLLGYGNSTKISYSVLQMEEALFLCHLISTLAMLIHHAKDLPDTPTLALRVLEFVWPIRSHSDAAVTQAMLYCISVLLQAIPVDDLVAQKSRIVEDVRNFLSNVERNDPYTKSTNMAKRINTILDLTLQAAILQRGADGPSNAHPGKSTPLSKGLTSDTIREISMASQNLSLLSTV